jgi:hypothetical protein
MSTSVVKEKDTRVPEGYVTIPVQQSEQGAPVRICVLVRQTPEPAGGSFVLLRDQHDSRVYLGALVDAGGRVREWLELWVQTIDGLDASLPAHRESFSNHSLDKRWAERAETFCQLAGAHFLRTGWESVHPLPTFLDLSQAVPVHPGSAENGGRWELCRDDKLLQAAGLPAYSTSLFRYLYQPGAAAGSPFVPVAAGATENAATRPLAQVLTGVEHHLAFNAQGGLMMVLSLSPLAYEEYADLLGGRSWGGIEHGKKRLQLDGAYQGLGEWDQTQQDNAHLFLGARGKAGRFLETYHLKMQLLAEVFRQVRAFVQAQQLPFLNLSADSFRVGLGEIGGGLPLLWTARCGLVKPGTAFALPVETSDFRYFIRARNARASIYLPEGLSASLQASGNARIRKVLPPDQGRTVLEGTLVVQERLSVSPHDLLWIRLPLPSGRLDLYGHLYAAEALAQGEIRFRTVPQHLPETVAANLRAAEGVAFARAPFEVVPLLSTPCDLYALGVLAVRTLLVDGETTLPIALDEALSLARQAAAEHKPDVPAGARIRAILEGDPRYAASLGPHRLNYGGLGPEEAGRLLPLELWCDTLAFVVSLFPGLGPDSVCRDFGDVPALALETVFNRPTEELEKLVVRSRSLIVIDWAYNQEIHAAIKKLLPAA